MVYQLSTPVVEYGLTIRKVTVVGRQTNHTDLMEMMMGIDNFSFSSQIEGKKRYGEEPSNLCACGKDMANHTLREKRACDSEN